MDTNMRQFLSIYKNRITGVLGNCIDKLLSSPEKRKCILKGSNYLGVKLSNGTYTGILGELQSNQADMYLKGEPDYLNEPWLERTLPMKTENLVVMQRVYEKNMNLDYFDLTANFQFGLPILASYFLSFLGIILTCLFIIKMKNKLASNPITNREILTIFQKDFFTKKYSLSAMGIFILFFHLFFWYTQLFMTNNIKTNKVVVDTSDLVKSKEDILNSKRGE